MVLFAKRVSACVPAPIMASRSRTPSCCAADAAASKISRARARVSSADSGEPLAGIGATDLDPAESRGARPVPCPHHLLGLALSAVRCAPERPVLGARNCRAGIPEFRADAAVTGVLQHARAFSIADFPSDLTAELEVVPLVIDRPALVGLHVDGVAGAKNFVETLPARLEADVGHANERNARPAVGAHGAVRALLADRGRSFTRRHIANEKAVADDICRLRGNAFIVESESAQTGAVFGARIAY